MSDAKQVNLFNLNGGAAVEMFARELERVVERVVDNILDVNTEPDAKRQIVLKITFAPTKDRDMGATIIEAEAKLAPFRGVATTLFFGRHQGRNIAVESNPKQADLFDESSGELVPIEGGKA